MSKISINLHKSIHEISATIWNDLNGKSIFTSYEYLSALEDSGCIVPITGWQSSHISIRQNNDIIGIMPLYIKSHSMGEYIFDQSWAQAYERANLDYYPKLLSASPFTPVNGNRLLAKSKSNKLILLQALKQICDINDLSSVHINFLNSEDLKLSKSVDFQERNDIQYWWYNKNCTSFEDFLAILKASHRKNIKRERREVLSNVKFKILTGKDIKESDLDTMYGFIKDTYDRKWGKPYLNREFFSLVNERLADNIVLILGYINDNPVFFFLLNRPKNPSQENSFVPIKPFL